MKPRKNKEIMDQFTIEVKESVPETIRKLQELSGPCLERDGNGYMLAFLCNKKGKFRVDDFDSDMRHYGYHRLVLSDRVAYVEGYVTCENGKTVVHGQCVFNHSKNIYRVAMLTLSVIALVLYSVLALLNAFPFSFFHFLMYLGFVVLTVAYEISKSNNESYNRVADLEIMKEEAIRRIRAVDRWDE